MIKFRNRFELAKYILLLLMFLFGWRGVKRNRDRIAEQLSPLSLRNLVLQDMVKVFLAILLPLLFVFNESCGCIMRNYQDDVRICEDKILSNSTFTLTFVFVGSRMGSNGWFPNEFVGWVSEGRIVLENGF